MFLLTPVKGRIRSEKLDIAEDIRNLFPLAPKALVDFSDALDDIDVPCVRGSPGSFFQFSGFLERRRVPSAVSRWLNDAIVTHNVGSKLVEKSGIISSDADLRIRPFTVAERTTVQRWLMLSQEIDALSSIAVMVQKTLDLTSEEDRALKFSSDNTLKSVERKITGLKEKQDAATPQWWKEWRHVTEEQ
ncbi:hypothetical protein C0992_010235 [Termitomyces sp. T32_za158]|nr:hypothetical protein C0992_010235 [Termitomyces sp. T32_za158]